VSTLFIIIVVIQVAWVPAFWAHAAGFLAGVLLVKPFENRTLSNSKRARVHLSRGEIPRGGWW